MAVFTLILIPVASLQHRTNMCFGCHSWRNRGNVRTAMLLLLLESLHASWPGLLVAAATRVLLTCPGRSEGPLAGCGSLAEADVAEAARDGKSMGLSAPVRCQVACSG
jgi:hypothetical protein